MKDLTPKEEEVLAYFWKHDAMFVKDLLELYENPKPHYNTLSTIVRILEEKGYISHKSYGNTHQYYPLVSQKDYSNNSLKHVVSKYFDNSYSRIVSSLVEEEKIDIDELQALIDKIKNQEK